MRRQGDLTGLAEAGASSRSSCPGTAANGCGVGTHVLPGIELLSLGGAILQFLGVPVRAEVSDFGPDPAGPRTVPEHDAGAGPVLIRVGGRPDSNFVDLPDSCAVISLLWTSDEGKEELGRTIGGASKATAGHPARPDRVRESQGGGPALGY